MPRRRQRRQQVVLNVGDVARVSDDEIAIILRAADPLVGTAGRNMLTKVLKGSREKALLAHGLDDNPAYGAMKDLSLEAIQHRVDWLIVEDYLHIQYRGPMPTVCYSEKGLRIETQTIIAEWLSQCQAMIQAGGPYLMTFLLEKNRATILRLLDAIANLADPEFVPLLEAWQALEVKKLRKRIRQVILELQGKGPSLRSHFECCLVDESVSEMLVTAWQLYDGADAVYYDRLERVADTHQGMQDIEIIQRLLDQHTCLLTSDVAFHNAALAKGKYSVYVREDGTFQKEPVSGIKPRGILGSNEPMVPRPDFPDTSHHEREDPVVTGVMPSDPRKQKSIRTKRRRIRNYVGGVANISSVAVTASQQPMQGGNGILIGIRLRVSSRSGGLKALDASESYIHEHTSDPLAAYVHALVILSQLHLNQAPIHFYYDTASLLAPTTIEDSAWMELFEKLVGTVPELKWIPSDKGFFVDRVRSKLTALQRSRTNEIVVQDLAQIAGQITGPDIPADRIPF